MPFPNSGNKKSIPQEKKPILFDVINNLKIRKTDLQYNALDMNESRKKHTYRPCL